MILPIFGFSTNIPSSYDEIIRRLKMLGLSPTGNPQFDKSRLKQAINNRVEKIEEKKEEAKKEEEISIEKQLIEKRIGENALGEQNRFYFGL